MVRWLISGRRARVLLLLCGVLFSCGGRKSNVKPPPPGVAHPVGDVVKMRALVGKSASGQVVGSLPLSFTVGDDGRASAEIDVDIPPGTAQVQPQVSFGYDSGAPNGKAGMGWQVSAAAAISRVGANIEQDGFRGGVAFTADDRYALNGMRLICVSGADGQDGSQYRTERDTFQIVTASGTCGTGPCSFTVVNTQGHTQVFGGTTDSRILAGAGPTVWSWALSSETDLHGNSVQYQYTRVPYNGAPDLNDYYLQTITYTVNSSSPIPKSRTVTFTWQQRPDVETRYIGGLPFGTGGRLARVTTAVDGQTVSDYRVTYDPNPDPTTGRSRAVSFARCDGTDSAALCLPATTEAWQSEVGAWVDQGQVLQGSSPAAQFLYPAWDPSSNPRFLADVNGDGRGDIVGFRLGVQVSLATGSQFAAQSQWNADFGNGWTSQTPRMVGDLNGDGMGDVLGFGFGGLLVGISTGSSFDESKWSGQGDTSWTAGWNFAQNPRMLADVNGDGLDDIVGFGDQTYVSLSTGSSFGAKTSWNAADFTGSPWQTSLGALRMLADVNGDGRADVVGFAQTGVIVGISTGGQTNQFSTSLWPQNASGFPNFGQKQGWMPGTHPRMLADVNGDGLADIVGFRNGVQVSLLTGTGFLAPQQWNAGFSQESSPPWTSSATRYVADLNGDGKGDVIGFNNVASGGAAAALSNGSSSFTTSTWSSAPLNKYDGTQANYPILFGDSTGDGLPDVVSLGANVSTAQRQVTQGAPAGPYPDLMTQLTTGWGGVHTVTYRPMTDPTIYSKGTPAGQGQDAVIYQDPAAAFNYSAYASAFPVRQVQSGNAYLVATYAQTNSPSVSKYSYDNQFSYFYTGAKLDVLALRDLGMQTVATTRQENGVVTTVTYNQAFPLTRTHVLTATTCGPNSAKFDAKCTANTLLTQTATTYTAQQTAQGVTGAKPVIAFPAMSGERQDYYDYGTYDYSIGQQHTFDSWGNESTTSYLGYVDQQLQRKVPASKGKGAKKAPAKAAVADAVADTYLVCSTYSDDQPSDPRYRSFLTARKVTTATSCSTGFDKGVDSELSSYVYSTDGKMDLLQQQGWDDQSGSNLSTSYTYDAWGNPATVTDPGQQTTQLAYDADYRAFPTLQTSPLLGSGSGYYLNNQLYYEPRFGTLATKVDPNGLVTINCVDSFGRLSLVQTTAPSGGPTDTNCLPSGAVGSTAAVLTVRTQSWGNDGEIYRQQQDLQVWPADSSRVWQSDYSYEDSLTRVYKKVSDSTGSTGETVICYQRDDLGTVTGTSTPSFQARTFDCQAQAGSVLWQTVTLDAYDRQVRISTPAGTDGKTPSITTYAYSGSNTTTVTQAAGTPQAFTRVLSQVVRSNKQLLSGMVVASDGNATSAFGYDQLGRITSAQDPGQVTTSTAYDSLSRRISLSSPDYGQVTWTYAGGPTVQTMTTPRGSVTYTYDSIERMTGSSASDGTNVAYTYDNAAVPNSKQFMTRALVTYAGGSAVQTDYLAYDPYGNVTSQGLTVPGRQNAYVTGKSFDPQGRAVQVVLPDSQGTIGYAFTDSTLTQITFNGQTVAGLSGYTALGLKGAVTFNAPGTSEAYGYDPTGDLLSLTVTSSKGKLLDLGWMWNALDQVTQITDNLKPGGHDLSEAFGYTNLRLTSANGPYGSRSYGYDSSGNLTAIGSTTFTYDGHRVMSGTSGGQKVFSASYDPAGGMTTKTAAGKSWTYTYDLNAQLTQVSQQGVDGPVYTFLTDHTGRRVVATSTQQTVTYVNENYKVVQPASGSATTVAYFLDSGAPIASVLQGGQSAWVFLHRNHLSSTVLASQADGSVGTYIEYEPYGGVFYIDPAFDQQVDRKFTGRELDSASGLYYFGTRYYDPAIGRFLTPDTGIGGDLDTPDSQNSYAYAMNNPAKYVDTDGTQPWAVFGSFFRFFGSTSSTFLRSSTSVFRYTRLFTQTSRIGYTDSLFSSRWYSTGGFRSSISFGDDLPTTSFNESLLRGPSDIRRWMSTSIERGSEQGTSDLDVFNGRANAQIAQSIAKNGIKWDMIPENTRFGRAFYVAGDKPTADAELLAHGQEVQGYVRLRISLSRTKLLDMTDPDVQAQWGTRFPGWDATGVGDYSQGQALAQAAREAGYDAIRYASIRNPGGTCYAIFPPRATAPNALESAASGVGRTAATSGGEAVGSSVGGESGALGTEAATEGAAAVGTGAETGLDFLAILGFVAI